MRFILTCLPLAASAGATTVALSIATPAAAYPVDCAILLCLAGGWPASVECAHARTVFIARITPWPVEPPLQIWNCPMHAAARRPAPVERLFNIAFRGTTGPQISEAPASLFVPLPVVDQADIDISDLVFDFVRSIRVFEIQYRQHRSSDGDCRTSSVVNLGSYGEQGDYTRRRSGPTAIPEASDFHLPTQCNNYSYRSVFVEWRDVTGTYGHEEVPY